MKQFEYEQQLDHLKVPVDDISKILSSKPVAEWAYIIHDKDVDVAPHLHLMVKLANSDMTPQTVCKWFNDEPQYINIKQSRWGSKLSYLCHRTPNDGNKYQYDPADVVANFDYPARLTSITESVARKMGLDDILEDINRGKIREYNLTDFVDVHTFSKNKTVIINALEYYRRAVMTNPDRNINVIMISGPAGCGKTTLAKQYCKNNGWRYCVSSSSNDPMQDYKGEPVLILDDLRHDAFKYHDFLKLLDNHTKSSTASRYSNKAFIGETIIITSPDKLWFWYPNTDESKQQLYRRINIYMEMDYKQIKTFVYDNESKVMKYVNTSPNTITMTFKETKTKLIDTLKGFGIELSQDVQDEIMNARTDLDNEINAKLLEQMEKDENDDLPF